MIYNPDTIIQCLSTQSPYINIVPNRLLYYTDTNQLYYDSTDKIRTIADDIIIIQHEYERNNYIPDNKAYFISDDDSPYFVNNQDYTIVYVVESNSLYRYQAGTWTTIYGVYGRTTVAQTYYPDGDIVTVDADDVTTNGILNDGSVVVRDGNKMICGLLRSDGYVFDINSLIGGQLNLSPSGKTDDGGTLSLNSNITTGDLGNIAFLNGDLIIFGNIYRAPAEDWNKQYRLITEDIQIIANTLIKAGSTIKAGSVLEAEKYTEDKVLTIDLEVSAGKIATGSKIYKDSVINNETLKPPFLFDIDRSKLNSVVSDL